MGSLLEDIRRARELLDAAPLPRFAAIRMCSHDVGVLRTLCDEIHPGSSPEAGFWGLRVYEDESLPPGFLVRMTRGEELAWLAGQRRQEEGGGSAGDSNPGSAGGGLPCPPSTPAAGSSNLRPQGED